MQPAEFAAAANHLWQSTVCAGAAGLLTLALGNNRARVRHAVWLAASCKFLFPLALLLALGREIPWRPPAATTQLDFTVALDEAAQPFTAAEWRQPSAAQQEPATNPLSAVIWSIWACGFLGTSCSWWVKWRRIRAAVRAGRPAPMAIPVPAVMSPVLAEPGVFGIFRPILLLPEGITDRLTPEQLAAVAAHELCHVRHRDNLTAAIQMFVEALFWFHPAVWWIGRRMVEERERACDEAVLEQGSEPRVYAEAILNVCKLYTESPLACVAGVTGADLKRRIAAILAGRRGRKLNGAKKLLLAAAGAVLVGAPLVTGMWHGTAAAAEASPFAPEMQAASFEVASVKPAAEPAREQMFCIGACTFGERFSVTGPRVDIRFASLYNLLVTAYRIRPHQLSGPEWMRSQRFDIAAKMPQGASPEQLPEMLQALLADRFQLAIHRERKEQPVLALVVGRSGLKLPGPPANAEAPLPEGPGNQPLYTPQGEARQTENGDLVVKSGVYGPMRGGRGAGGGMRWEFLKLSMPALAALLTPHVDRPVIDQTHLPGSYALTFENRPVSAGGAGRKGGEPPEMGREAGRQPDPFGEGLLRAIGQAGLKLEARRAPVETIVVDHLEKVPSGN